jgi:hypothetical protein
MRNRLIILVVVSVVAGFLGYTKPGHSLLNRFGLATACSGSYCAN